MVDAAWWVAGVFGVGAVVALAGAFSAQAWLGHVVVGGLLAALAGTVVAVAKWWRATEADRTVNRLLAEGRKLVHSSAVVSLVEPTIELYARLRRTQDQAARIR